MGVYDPLTRHLKALPSDTWNVNFSEIERIIARPLPKSAHEHRPWWANQRDSNHSQAKAWRDAGWEVREVDLPRQTVRFERMEAAPPAPSAALQGGSITALIEKAHTVTGIEDRDALIEEALKALIARDLAKYFGSLGGSMPDFRPAPRERPWS